MAFGKADCLDFFIKFRVVWEEVEDYKEQIIIELNLIVPKKFPF